MRNRGVTLVDLAMLVIIAALLATFLQPVLFRKRAGCGGGTQSRCSNNLRQIGMAAIQYTDDKRFFPHVSALRQLDGGFDSNTAARCMGRLIFFNYHDNLEGFVCPSSPDQFQPLSEAARADIRSFGWAGGDVPLGQMTDLSYGWTKRGYTGNSLGQQILAGDKARVLAPTDAGPRRKHVGNATGNHQDCTMVVHVDGHTKRLTRRDDDDVSGVTMGSIAAVTPTAAGAPGFLGVLQDDENFSQ